jgi:DHA2 family multidrug resistance protein
LPAFDPLPLDCERSTAVTSQAAVMGLDDFFYASTFIFILIIPLIWITRPVKGGRDSGEASAAH